MTREEAIELKAAVGRLMYSNNKDVRDYNALIDFIESALRPVTREQVEKMRGEIVETVEKGRMKRVFSCCGCDFTSLTCWITPKFCPSCGAPITDEAVDMVMERLEALGYGKDD